MHSHPSAPLIVRSVLHPTDFSAASEQAFASALAIALLNQTQLTLLHVQGKSEHTDWSRFPAVRKTLERWGLLDAESRQTEVYEKLKVRIDKVGLKSSFTTHAISEYLDSNPHDLIVLATEGEAGLPHWFSRSESESIARAAKTMALFVPQAAERGVVSLDDGAYTLQNILVPVDHEPACGPAIEIAKRMANSSGEQHVTICLLHVGVDVPALQLEDAANWTMRVEQQEGEVVEQILAAAERMKADTIVMTSAGAQGFIEMLRGSTTQQVLRKARCPVVVVPA